MYYIGAEIAKKILTEVVHNLTEVVHKPQKSSKSHPPGPLTEVVPPLVYVPLQWGGLFEDFVTFWESLGIPFGHQNGAKHDVKKTNILGRVLGALFVDVWFIFGGIFDPFLSLFGNLWKCWFWKTLQWKCTVLQLPRGSIFTLLGYLFLERIRDPTFGQLFVILGTLLETFLDNFGTLWGVCWGVCF